MQIAKATIQVGDRLAQHRVRNVKHFRIPIQVEQLVEVAALRQGLNADPVFPQHLQDVSARLGPIPWPPLHPHDKAATCGRSVLQKLSLLGTWASAGRLPTPSTTTQCRTCLRAPAK